MTDLTICRKTLRDARGMTIGLGIAEAAIAFFDVLAFPSYRNSLKDFQMPEIFKGFLGEAASIGTPEGFLTTEFFSWAPILLVVLAIVAGTWAFAGEEANGTLDLLAAQPVKRWRFAAEKCLALTIATMIAALASVAGYAVGTLSVEMGVGIGRFTAATLNMIPLALLFLGLALLLSAALPSRGAAAIPVIGLVVITYFAQILSASVPAVHRIRWISPFYWAEPSRVLFHGFQWLRSGVMLALALALMALAVWALERREIATGAREWHPFARLPLPLRHDHAETEASAPHLPAHAAR